MSSFARATKYLEEAQWNVAKRQALVASALAEMFEPVAAAPRARGATFGAFGLRGSVLDPRALSEEQRAIVRAFSGESFWYGFEEDEDGDEDEEDTPPRDVAADHGIPKALLQRRYWLGLEHAVSCEPLVDGDPFWMTVRRLDVASARKAVGRLDPTTQLELFLEEVVSDLLGPYSCAIKISPEALFEKAYAFDRERALAAVDRIVATHLEVLASYPQHDVDPLRLDALIAASHAGGGKRVEPRIEPLLIAARPPLPRGLRRRHLAKVAPDRREAFLIASLEDALRRAPPSNMGFVARTLRGRIAEELTPFLVDYPTPAFAQRLVRLITIGTGYETRWAEIRTVAGEMPAVKDALDRLKPFLPMTRAECSRVFASYPVDSGT